MTDPTLVIVTGLPATGKTTIGTRISKDLLNLPGPVIEVDTTDFGAIDYPAICKQVEASLEPAP